MPERGERLAALILDAEVSFSNQPLLHPLVISSGSIEAVTLATVAVRVRCGRREAVGRGSIFLSDLWAWPDATRSHAERDAVLRRACSTMAARLPALAGSDAAHPLELGLRLHEAVCRHTPAALTRPPLPALALAMCLSPFDAALHDAAGLARRQSAFAFYRDDVPIPSADVLFKRGGACSAIRAMLRRRPLRRLPAWILVGKNDDIDRDVRPWVRDRGYRCFKLKIMGRSASEDADRTAEVFRALRSFGVARPRLSADSNEGHAGAAAVGEYLSRLRERDREAYAALEYIEQPTARDIERHAFDWRPVTALKPVLLDEGLTSFERLEIARAQGWSGLALKTCKGHSFALAAAAWAHRRGMPVALQDLTNPGYSAIHAALFAAYIPTINGVELNSPQFTPAANEAWLPRLAGMLDPRDGTHRLPTGVPRGLGSEW